MRHRLKRLGLATGAVLVASAAGCGPYAAARHALCAEVDRGISLTEEHVRAQADVVESLGVMERRRLDEAFEQELAETPGVSPEWVLEAATAYADQAVAIDRTIAGRRLSAERASENLAATRAALDRIEQLDRVEMQLAGWRQEQ